MEDIYSIIFDLLSTKDYLNLRCLSSYFNNYICNNKFCSRTISVKNKNVALLKSFKISGIVYDVDLCEDRIITNNEVKQLSDLMSLKLRNNKNITDEGIKGSLCLRNFPCGRLNQQ
jgi:hypothetical protein